MTKTAMGKLLFMSPKHFATMNALLGEAPCVKVACASLAHNYLLEFDIKDDLKLLLCWVDAHPQRGLLLGLGKPARAPDVTIQTRYADVVDASVGIRNGIAAFPKGDVSGNLVALMGITPVLLAARSVAVVDVDYSQFQN